MEWQHEGPAVRLYDGEWEHDQRHGKGSGQLVCADWVPPMSDTDTATGTPAVTMLGADGEAVAATASGARR